MDILRWFEFVTGDRENRKAPHVGGLTVWYFRKWVEVIWRVCRKYRMADNPSKAAFSTEMHERLEIHISNIEATFIQRNFRNNRWIQQRGGGCPWFNCALSRTQIQKRLKRLLVGRATSANKSSGAHSSFFCVQLIMALAIRWYGANLCSGLSLMRSNTIMPAPHGFLVQPFEGQRQRQFRLEQKRKNFPVRAAVYKLSGVRTFWEEYGAWNPERPHPLCAIRIKIVQYNTDFRR